MKVPHIDARMIQAYLDAQLSPADREQVEAHLAECALCAERFKSQKELSDAVRSRLDTLTAHVQPSALPQARTRFQAYTRQKEMETPNMNKSIFNRYRTAWITAALALILAVALFFPQVRAIANSFLGLFRVQQITVVQVSENLPEQLSQSTQFEMLFSENVQFEQQGESQVVDSAAQASELVGFAVRQPQGVEGNLEFMVTPAEQMKFTVDLEKLHAVLDEMGRSDLRLPKAVDGAEIVAEIQPGVSITYGLCDQVQTDPDNPDAKYYKACTSLEQIPSPTVQTPEGLDMRRIGEVYMQFLGMSAAEARTFSENVDWANTLVIPIPTYAMNYQQVAVDGVMGTFLTPTTSDSRQEYLLFWVKNDLVYILYGEGGMEKALEIVDSLK